MADLIVVMDDAQEAGNHETLVAKRASMQRGTISRRGETAIHCIKLQNPAS